jgi:hypothetical protein
MQTLSRDQEQPSAPAAVAAQAGTVVARSLQTCVKRSNAGRKMTVDTGTRQDIDAAAV